MSGNRAWIAALGGLLLLASPAPAQGFGPGFGAFPNGAVGFVNPMAVNPGFTTWNGFQTAAVPGAIGAGFYGGFWPGYGYGYPMTTGYPVVTGNPTGGGLGGFYNGPPQLTTNALGPLMNAIRSSARTGWSTPPW